MSIHLCSQDIHEGNIYDGTWTFNKNLTGSYQIDYQHMIPSNIPWVYPGCNELYIVNAAIPSQNGTVSFPTSYDDDSDAVQLWFINAVDDLGWVAILGSSYDAATNRYSFEFDKLVNIYTSPDQSSIAPVFDWVYNTPLHTNPVTSFTFSGKYINSLPNILEVHSSSIESEVINANGDNPAFFIATNGLTIQNQQVNILNNTNELDLQLYRPNNHSSPINIYSHYDVILRPI